MGFANVLTNSEVTLSVRDMVEYCAEVEEKRYGQLRYDNGLIAAVMDSRPSMEV